MDEDSNKKASKREDLGEAIDDDEERNTSDEECEERHDNWLADVKHMTSQVCESIPGLSDENCLLHLFKAGLKAFITYIMKAVKSIDPDSPHITLREFFRVSYTCSFLDNWNGINIEDITMGVGIYPCRIMMTSGEIKTIESVGGYFTGYSDMDMIFNMKSAVSVVRTPIHTIQHSLFMLLLSPRFNLTWNHNAKYIDFLSLALASNTYLCEYACLKAARLVKNLASSDLQNSVSLDINDEQLACVLLHSLPLSKLLLFKLQNVIRRETGELFQDVPDFFKLRLTYEITSHLYWFRMTAPIEETSTHALEKAARDLYDDVCHILDNEPKSSHFAHLKLVIKVLNLMHLVLAEIVFSITIKGNHEFGPSI